VDRAVGRAAVELEELPTDAGRGAGEPWKTVLFNCDCHTFDEVEKIVMKAVRCTLSRARAISNEVHTKGSAIIYEGHRERCEAVADVVAGIGLKVKVVP
jgi:ATP-dependent Clp protease adaptor protein ClpS